MHRRAEIFPPSVVAAIDHEPATPLALAERLVLEPHLMIAGRNCGPCQVAVLAKPVLDPAHHAAGNVADCEQNALCADRMGEAHGDHVVAVGNQRHDHAAMQGLRIGREPAPARRGRRWTGNSWNF